MTDDGLRRMVEAVNALPGFTSSVEMHTEAVRPGHVALSLARRPDLLQFGGHFHAGVITGLADQAAGAAFSTTLPAERICVTVELKINFLAPGAGDQLIARADVLKSGGTIGVVKSEVYARNGASETLCAFATVTLRSVDRPKARS